MVPESPSNGQEVAKKTGRGLMSQSRGEESKANGHKGGESQSRAKGVERLGQMDKKKGRFYFQIGLQNINICRACSFGGNQTHGV